MREGKALVIENKEGFRTTPSIIYVSKDKQITVGRRAKSMMNLYPNNVFYALKRLIGKSHKEIIDNPYKFNYPLLQNKDGGVMIQPEGMEPTLPVTVFAQVLKYLINCVEDKFKVKVSGAVVTVPAYFNDLQRRMVKEASESINIKVLRLLSEPTAAAISYGLDNKGTDLNNVVVYDLGGGTFDLSILDIEDGMITVTSTSGDTYLGGEDFIHAIQDYIVKDIEKQGLSLTDVDRFNLKDKSEEAMKIMSGSDYADISIQLASGQHYSKTLYASEYKTLVKPFIDKTIGCCKNALREKNLSVKDVSKILMVGAVTRDPFVQEAVKTFFDKELDLSLNPDEAIAIGAGILSSTIAGEQKGEGLLLMDVIPLSLGIETVGGIMTNLVEKNTNIPVKQSQIFSTATDYQSDVEIKVYQGNRTMAADNECLGSFVLKDIKSAKKGVPQIEVSFDVDMNSLLTVTAVDKDTQKSQSISIDRSNLSKEDIEKMKSEASEFSAKDQERKDIAVSKNMLHDLIYQIEDKASGNKDLLSNHQDQLDEAKKTLSDANCTLEDLKRLIESTSKIFNEVLEKSKGKADETSAKDETTKPQDDKEEDASSTSKDEEDASSAA